MKNFPFKLAVLEDNFNILVYYTLITCAGSPISIATDYGLDGPGSNPEIFSQSRPALWTTHPPVKWLPNLSQG